MGKIHDAIEKAQKKTRKPGQTLPDQRQKNDNEKITPVNQNVVQLHTNHNSMGLKPDDSLVTFFKPHSMESELIKNIRTNILFPEHGNPVKTILVTSASPEDGKTFTSANLACSIAQGIEEYVLLIDCDLRKSSVHKIFGFGRVEGLSDYLMNEKQVSDIIYKTPIPKLSIIPAGRAIPPNPTELLSSNKMAALIEEAKHRYNDRFIVIDSPPPQLTSETKAIARQVDGVLLVVNNRKTKKKMIREVVEEIGKDKIIGVVLNKVGSRSMKKPRL